MAETNFRLNNTGIGGLTRAQKFIVAAGGLGELRKNFLFTSEELEEDEPVGTSLLGTPVFSNLEIKPGQFTNLDGDIITFEGLRIDTVLMNVTQSKNIVKTGIVGKSGTVKEYISDGDFLISMDGLIIGETVEGSPQKESGVGLDAGTILRSIDIGNKYPERDADRFIKMAAAPIALEVNSQFLDRFGITHVVIEDWGFPQSPGTKNIQLFNMRLSSDKPIELQ